VTGRRPETVAAAGPERREEGPLATPIVLASTFSFESAARLREYLDRSAAHGPEEGETGFFYTRYGNPTLRELERALAELEGGEDALVFASGMAATTCALLTLLAPGDVLAHAASSYGGTLRLTRDVLERFGVRRRAAAGGELADACAGDPPARVLWFESPTNPLLEIVDIEAVARAARAQGTTVVVDNTFASPALQNPLALGADLVMHSLTKSLAGHSDVTAGALVGRRALIGRCRDTAKLLGATLDPHAAYLALRGLRTLHLRAERSSRNAWTVAETFRGHPAVERVLYPGLADHPGHEVARRQMRHFGAQVTIDVRGGQEAAERVYDRLGVVRRAVSLGGVESLVSLPVLSSHAGLAPDELRAAGVTHGMLRFSIGVEHVDDIVADLRQALEGRVPADAVAPPAVLAGSGSDADAAPVVRATPEDQPPSETGGPAIPPCPQCGSPRARESRLESTDGERILRCTDCDERFTVLGDVVRARLPLARRFALSRIAPRLRRAAPIIAALLVAAVVGAYLFVSARQAMAPQTDEEVIGP
jgi:cystathionine beta-lyase/cystathionine gamma-synthase